MEPFLTIKQNGQAEIDIKKSRFICSLGKVTTETEAKAFIAQVVSENEKANHNCFAYLLGDDDHIQRESDDGEPSGTAGVPILNVLQQEKLHNVVAVTTRYFGGIKLGAGGLIRAYSNATSTAIRKVGLVRRVTQTELQINTDYASYEKLAYYISKNELNAATPIFAASVSLSIFVDKLAVLELTDRLTSLLAGKLSLVVGGDRFQEIDYNNSNRQ